MPKDEAPKRQYLTMKEHGAMFRAQRGLCGHPDCTSRGPFEADHSIPSAWVGGKPDVLLCRQHHKEKTKADIKKIWKAKRLREERTQHDRRLKNGPKLRSNNMLRSRGFDKTKSKRMDGSVVEKPR